MESVSLKPAGRSEPILIIDDEPAAVESLRRILRRSGYANVLGCPNPRAAPEAIERYRPSLVLLDLQMPGVDGMEIIRHIRRSYRPEVAPMVLVVTGALDRDSRLQALECGARDYLLKPYDPPELLLRVRNLLEIRSQGQALAGFLDATPAAMIAVDIAGCCTYINRSALSLLGYTQADQVVGRDLHTLARFCRTDGSALTHSECAILGALDPVTGACEGEGLYWRADGTSLPMQYYAHSLTCAGATEGALITLIDLRDRRESERRSRLANTVFESVDQALMITDAKADIVAINRAYTQLTGWEASEVIGRNPRFRQSGRHDRACYLQMWQSLIDAGGWQGELWNLRKDGNAYLEEVKITTVRDGSGDIAHFVAAISDLTEVRRHQEELELARERADAASQAKSRFVANMSHEIRTPLTAIVGFAETLNDEGQSGLDRKESVETILRAGRYLLELVNGILDFSKIEADRLEIECIEITLAELLEEVLALAAARAQAKGIGFEVEIKTPWPRRLLTDPTRAKQILVNLLSNAIKFTDRGSVRLEVALDSAREHLVCAVIDTGIGVEAHRVAELFESFVQADASTVRKHGGSGLGLTISRALARRLGGDVTAQSTLGAGSRFTATLATGPLDDSMLEQAPPDWLGATLAGGALPGAAIESSAMPRLAGDVLLAEDNPDNRRLVKHLLERAGARVTLADNGQEAVEHAQERDLDLILMDMQMPVMDGLDATRLLRLTGFDGPIVALTANATEEDRHAALVAGCDDFLTKPIQRHDFHAVLMRYLSVADGASRSDDGLSVLLDEERYRALRDSFMRDLPGRLEAMAQALEGVDLQRLAGLAHQLKGVGGSFGLPQATRLAGALETRAREGEEQAARRLLTELEDLCRSVSR